MEGFFGDEQFMKIYDELPGKQNNQIFTECENLTNAQRQIQDVMFHALENIKFDEEENKRWKSHKTYEEKIEHLTNKLVNMASNSAETEAAIERLCSRKCKRPVIMQTPRKSMKTFPSPNYNISNQSLGEADGQFQDLPKIIHRPKYPRKCRSKGQFKPFRKLFKTAAFPSKTQWFSSNNRSSSPSPTRPQTSPQLLRPKVSLFNRPTTIHGNDQDYSHMIKTKGHKTPFLKDQNTSIPVQPRTKFNVPPRSRSPSPLNQSRKSLKPSKLVCPKHPPTKPVQQKPLPNKRHSIAIGKIQDFTTNVAIASTPHPRKPKSAVGSKNTQLPQPYQQPNNVKKPAISLLKQPTKFTQPLANLNKQGSLPTKQIPMRNQQTKAPSYSLTKVKSAKTVSNKRIPGVKEASNRNVKNALPRGTRVAQVSNQNVKNVKNAKKSAQTQLANNKRSGNIPQRSQTVKQVKTKGNKKNPTKGAQAQVTSKTVAKPKKSPSKNVSLHKPPKKVEGAFGHFFDFDDSEARAYRRIKKKEKNEFLNLQKVKNRMENELFGEDFS